MPEEPNGLSPPLFPTPEPYAPPPGDGPSVRFEVGYPDDWDGVRLPAFELICEDEANLYYLPNMESRILVVAFEDGSKATLRDALEKNLIGVRDLALSGLSVYALPKD
ncbi:MAG: hypothetical protein FWF03_06235 [Defluviitaleaceae bacterium]|nr:hypothetical protein [Defluviitaleaceae bacterium]